jgi:archaellum component FlaC
LQDRDGAKLFGNGKPGGRTEVFYFQNQARKEARRMISEEKYEHFLQMVERLKAKTSNDDETLDAIVDYVQDLISEFENVTEELQNLEEQVADINMDYYAYNGVSRHDF